MEAFFTATPMLLSTWFVFLGVALLLCFTPGPGVLMAVSNAMSVGPRRAIVGSMGNAVGVFLVSAVSMAGLGVVLGASASAFTVLKVLGAAYLIWLGIKQWRSETNAFAAPPDEAHGERSGLRLFGHGVTVAVTNPKSILFFSALFPQFIRQDGPVLEQFLVLTATVAACSLLSHAFYVLVARGMKHSFSSASRARMFNRVTGGAFVALGIGMLRMRAKVA
jgi:threonine/homoserine/homoserine lactone efflux protein